MNYRDLFASVLSASLLPRGRAQGRPGPVEARQVMDPILSELCRDRAHLLVDVVATLSQRRLQADDPLRDQLGSFGERTVLIELRVRELIKAAREADDLSLPLHT